MSEEKQHHESILSEAGAGEDHRQRTTPASRAKNQTVMLSPEMTGQVRAMLNRDQDPNAALNQVLNQSSWERPGMGGIQPTTANNAQAAQTTGHGVSGEPTHTARPASHAAVHLGRESGPHIGEHVAESKPPMQPVFVSPTAHSVQHGMSHNVSHSVPHSVAPRSIVHPSVPPHAQTHVHPHVHVSAPVAPQKPVANTGVSVISHGKPTPLTGFLVSYDKDENGQVCELRSGRWLVSSQSVDQGSYILVDDDTVSPLHAIIRVSKDGRIQVLDQLSEYGTGLLKVGSQEEEEISGAMVEVSHGDVVRFGQRRFVVCLVPVAEAKR